MNRTALTMMMTGMLAASRLAAQTEASENDAQALPPAVAASLSKRLTGVTHGDSAANRFQTVNAEAARAPRALAPMASRDLIAPMVLNGYMGRNRVVTVFSLLNTGGVPAQVVMEFFDKTGNRVEIPFAGDRGNYEGSYEAADGYLAPSAKGGLVTYARGTEIVETYARLRSIPEGAVQMQVSHLVIYGAAWVRVATPAQTPQREFYFDVEDKDRGSRFFLVNGSPLAQTVTLRGRTPEGEGVCRWNKTVYPGQMLPVTPSTESLCMQGLSSFPHLLQVTAGGPSLSVGNYLLTSNEFLVQLGARPRILQLCGLGSNRVGT